MEEKNNSDRLHIMSEQQDKRQAAQLSALQEKLREINDALAALEVAKAKKEQP